MSKHHLFIIIHGLLGNASHVEYIAETIRSQLSDVTTFLPTCNTGFHTFDGIETCSSRLLIELEEFLEDEESNGIKFTKLSIVGYSMGGLIGRHLIGLMNDQGILENFELFSFTTFATPHAGSYFHKDVSYSSILNFFGSKLLGYAGNDLFMSKSSVLNDLADPNSKYFKALSRFKHLISFTNTSNDRTVPFWTGYISQKDPFQYRDHLDMKHSNYKPKSDAENEDLAEKYPRTFMDLGQSKYLSVSPTGKEFTPTGREKLLRLAVIIWLFFFPILIGVTGIMSLVSYWRVMDFRHSIKSKSRDSKDSTHSYKPGHRRRRSSLGEGVASTAMDAIGDMLVRAPANGPTSDEPAVDSDGPTPLFGPGYDGLIDSTPRHLDLKPSIAQIITKLNRLPWEKYAVRIERLHSHAEIVNRRNKPGQGCLVVGYWAQIILKKLEK